MLKSDLIALIESLPGESVEFVSASIHYEASDPEVVAVAKFPGIHPSGIFVKGCAA